MLKTISIKNYRNIANLDYEFSSTANIIIAPNGSGKTNFIESIFYTLFGESFRLIESGDQIKGPYNDFTKVVLSIDAHTIEFLLSENDSKLTRKYIWNGKRQTSAKISEKFPVLVFAPTSVDLVSREPAFRRADLDAFLSILAIPYRNYIDEYKKVMRNRNAVIKAIRERKANQEQLKYWTDKIIELSDKIFKYRYDFFENIQSYLEGSIELINKFSPSKRFSTLSIQYLNYFDCQPNEFHDILSNKFLENYEKEITVGRTLYGVHKDDFNIYLNSQNLRYMGSRGQQRVGALLYKLAQVDYLFDIKKELPILLLDDIMSELDDENRRIIFDILQYKGFQFVISSAEEKELPQKLLDMGKRINVI